MKIMDNDKKNRIKFLTGKFKQLEGKQNYVEIKDYYIQITKHNDSEGLRFYFRGKYQVEIVVPDKEGGPSKNICDFVLFSNFDDAILYAVLKEESYLRSLLPVNKYVGA